LARHSLRAFEVPGALHVLDGRVRVVAKLA
jgi:hypothetical protein